MITEEHFEETINNINKYKVTGHDSLLFFQRVTEGLINAVYDLDFSGVEFALREGANVNVVISATFTRETLLHHLARKGDAGLDIARLLIGCGADINARDRLGYTPLHTAGTFDRISMAELLIDSGADVNAEDNQGDTPIHNALMRGRYEIALLLREHGAKYTDSYHITQRINMIDTDRGKKIFTSLHMAALLGDTKIACSLIKNGVDINARDRLSRTPLHHAVSCVYSDIVKVLIDNGADVNARDRLGRTPLHFAMKDAAPDVIKLLIDNGAEE